MWEMAPLLDLKRRPLLILTVAVLSCRAAVLLSTIPPPQTVVPPVKVLCPERQQAAAPFVQPAGARQRSGERDRVAIGR